MSNSLPKIFLANIFAVAYRVARGSIGHGRHFFDPASVIMATASAMRRLDTQFTAYFSQITSF